MRYWKVSRNNLRTLVRLLQIRGVAGVLINRFMRRQPDDYREPNLSARDPNLKAYIVHVAAVLTLEHSLPFPPAGVA